MRVLKRQRYSPQIAMNLSSNVKFLGVTFNECLSWEDHISDVCKNASRRVFALRRLKSAGIKKDDLIIVYNAFIRSILEHNSPLYVGLLKKDSNKLDKINRMCHRVICGSRCRENCLGDLSERRIMRSLKVFQEMMQPNNLLHDLLPRRLLYSQLLESFLCKTHRRAMSFLPYCTTLYNCNLK